jgi:hypothetical protein
MKEVPKGRLLALPTSLERLAREEHSSLFDLFISDET